MSSPRFCLSCSEPRPSAAIRCPWCLHDYAAAHQVQFRFLDKPLKTKENKPRIHVRECN